MSPGFFMHSYTPYTMDKEIVRSERCFSTGPTHHESAVMFGSYSVGLYIGETVS